MLLNLEPIGMKELSVVLNLAPIVMKDLSIVLNIGPIGIKELSVVLTAGQDPCWYSLKAMRKLQLICLSLFPSVHVVTVSVN